MILSGGLGPTKDDLTKEVTAKVFGRELREDPHTRERIQEYFDRSGRKLTANNWKQALVPEGATVVDNHNGDRPGADPGGRRGGRKGQDCHPSARPSQ